MQQGRDVGDFEPCHALNVTKQARRSVERSSGQGSRTRPTNNQLL
jgi:hypothetical protein